MSQNNNVKIPSALDIFNVNEEEECQSNDDPEQDEAPDDHNLSGENGNSSMLDSLSNQHYVNPNLFKNKISLILKYSNN